MREDYWRLFIILVSALVAGGWLIGMVPSLLGGCAVYIFWQQRRLLLLLQWLENRKENDPPDSPGVFDALCREIDFMRERHRKRKKKLGGFLKQFQNATAALPDAAVVLSRSGEIQWANASAQQLLGIQWPRDVSQRLINIVRHPDLVNLLTGAAQGDKAIEIVSPANANVYLSLTLASMGPEQNLLLARNITHLQKLNQIRSDFVANVSHELRTPVTVIKGYLEAINSQPQNCPTDLIPIFSELEAQATRMGTIIDELLLLARLEQDDSIADPAVIEVPELIHLVAREAKALAAASQHELREDVDTSLRLLGAKADIYSAFSNLVVNAVRYTPAQGVIALRWYRDNEGAHFEVTDTGPGIPREHIPRLTERFYRVDRSRSRESGGTGLGLAIVKHVLKRHQASLFIESRVGQGSVFRCDFPHHLIVDIGPESMPTAAKRRR